MLSKAPIHRVSKEDLVKAAYQGVLPFGVDLDSLPWFGLYDKTWDVIYVLDTLSDDLNNPVNQCELSGVILHEEVHRNQFLNGEYDRVDCKEELETMAYYLEAEWLFDNNCISHDRMEHLQQKGETLGACP